MTAVSEIIAEPVREAQRVAVLLTGAGQRVSLVHSLRNIGQSLGLQVRVVVCDRMPRSRPACLIADAAYQTPNPFDLSYVDSILEICIVHRVCLVIPTDGAELLALGTARERFAAIGASIAGSGPDLVSMSNNPDQLQSLVGNAGIICEVTPAYADRQFEVLMYFDRDGVLRTVIPCERMKRDGGLHLVTRRCSLLEALAADIAKRLDEPRSVISFDAEIGCDGQVRVHGLRAHFGESFEIAHSAGAELVRWLLSEHCLHQQATGADWREGVEMLRYEASMFILPQ